MPWDGCELHVADLAPGGALSEFRARCRSGRRGVDLAARVESRRRPRVRQRQVRLVEPRADPRRQAGAAPCRGGRVRLSRMGLRRTVVRLPRRRSNRVRVREQWVHPIRRARTRVRRARAARRRPRLVEVAVRRDRRDDVGDRGRIAVGCDADRSCRRRHRRGGDRAGEHRGRSFRRRGSPSRRRSSFRPRAGSPPTRSSIRR